MSDVTIRPFQPRDLQWMQALLLTGLRADSITIERFTRQVLLDPNFRAAGMPVAVHENQIIGFCLAIARQTPLENAPSDVDRGYITLFAVLEKFQRQGIGGRLLSAAEEYLRDQGKSVVMIASYAPGYFIPGVDVNAYAGALEFLKKHGYAEVYRPLAMQTSLWDFATPAWVMERTQKLYAEDVTFSTFKPEMALPLIDFARKEFPGDWVRVIRETSAKIIAGESPWRLIVAIDQGAIVGFSHYENERFGPIGVAQSQRGRGVGQVLMYITLEAQRAAGFRVAWFLWSDDMTAERIYNGAGFKEVRRFALMKKGIG